ncbi:hypothetical protein [Nocardia abscessus]|uniref:hypothetical protein n=1 Tax=Nocardia abscessus TaxID=120957 RepID=UPI0024588BE4|nr:hypothetical protein [Nocardia abscessus]
MAAIRYDVNGWTYEYSPFDGVRLVKDYGPCYVTITPNPTPEVFKAYSWTVWRTSTGDHITTNRADSVEEAQAAADARAHPK